MDRLKGERVSRHYKEIAFIDQNLDSEQSAIQRSQYMHNILKHAVHTTPFYRQYKGYTSLTDFPVIQKTKVQECFNDFKSDTYLSQAKFRVHTSGSTGIPFELFQDANKKKRNTADTIYFLKKANFNIGERLYDLEVWRGINMNSPVKAWLQNLKYIDITEFHDEKIESFLQSIKNKRYPQHFIGFASAYEHICKYLDRTQASFFHTKIASILAISETLTDYVKETMQKYFGVPVISRYSNEEIGIMAQQTYDMYDKRFEINWSSYHFEILKMNQDVPAQLGELGRVVVTDFFNYCMPMIRYDTGDVASFGANFGKNDIPSRYFERIEGRKMDIVYNTRGQVISSFIVYTKFYKYYNLLRQYQFVQVSANEYVVKLNTVSSFNFEKELIDDIKKDFGQDAMIQIAYVDEIPALSSGKRKKVVNLYKSA
ncbi:CoF synthetase [Aquimarina sp. U1-2]|uniref:CoF synthetase n=1 Tax=Aquimarina sp. U1-2 TaxID=2823141 RepID=UPI001AECEC85|nr:CoF synthetase [Aquimarina sp. U1-2]MBP2833844.1 CoF synthetase [Aquimarina sp. U1-2]